MSKQINSIARAADALKLLSHGVTKLTEISKRLDVDKATVHRIMKTLENKGLVSQDCSTRKYYLGPLIQTLAENPLRVHQIVAQLAAAEMERLRDACGELVVLQIRRGGHRLVLEKAVSNQVIRYFPEKSETVPIYAGAGGKVLLAGLDKNELSRLLDRLDLIKIGPNTLTDKDELISDVEKIRSDGHAVSFGETLDGGAGIAVPVLNYSCPVALCIIGPEDRIKENLIFNLKLLKTSATLISNKIKEVTGIKKAHRSDAASDAA